jgi:hypothetical protein
MAHGVSPLSCAAYIEINVGATRQSEDELPHVRVM